MNNNDHRRMPHRGGHENYQRNQMYDHGGRNYNSGPQNDQMQRQYSGPRQSQMNQHNRNHQMSGGMRMHNVNPRYQNSPRDQRDYGPSLQSNDMRQDYNREDMYHKRREGQDQDYQYPLQMNQQRRMGPRKPVYNNNGDLIFEVYVHNVDFEVTANDVVNRFRGCGPIDHWKFPRKDATRQNHGRHKGYGFIYFKTKQAQMNALRMRNNPPIIGSRQINISDNFTQYDDEQGFTFQQEEDPYYVERPEYGGRQQQNYQDRYEGMDRYQRYDQHPRMMDHNRPPLNRPNFDDNIYQNNLDHFIPPRNLDPDDELDREVVMQKHHTTKDYDRGRLQPNRQILDHNEQQDYQEKNLVVVKKSPRNDQHSSLTIQKKDEKEYEKNTLQENLKDNPESDKLSPIHKSVEKENNHVNQHNTDVLNDKKRNDNENNDAKDRDRSKSAQDAHNLKRNDHENSPREQQREPDFQNRKLSNRSQSIDQQKHEDSSNNEGQVRQEGLNNELGEESYQMRNKNDDYYRDDSPQQRQQFENYRNQRRPVDYNNQRRPRDIRMSKTDSYGQRRMQAENTNIYNPNNREFIGYKSVIMAREREQRDQDYRPNNQRNFRQRGMDYNVRDRNQRQSNYRDARQNDYHRDERRMNAPHNRFVDRSYDQRRQDYNDNRFVNRMHDNDQNGQGLPRFNDQRNDHKRSYQQMDIEDQGYHQDTQKRQRFDNQQNQSQDRDRRYQRDDGNKERINQDQQNRSKQYADMKNWYNETRSAEGEYDSDQRYYNKNEMNERRYDGQNRSPERVDYEKQMKDKNVNQALDLYGEDDINYNRDQQSSNNDNFDNYDDIENKSVSFHEQLNDEKQKNKQYRNK